MLLFHVTQRFESIIILSIILCKLKLNQWRHKYLTISFLVMKQDFSAIGNQLQIGHKRIFFKIKYGINMLSTKYSTWRARGTKFKKIIFSVDTLSKSNAPYEGK